MTVLVFLDHDSLLVMWTPRNMKLSTCSNIAPLIVNGGLFGPPFTVDHDQLFCVAHIEGEGVVLAPHCQVSDLLSIGRLIVVSDQAHRCCVVSKLNDGVGVLFRVAIFWEYSEVETFRGN